MRRLWGVVVLVSSLVLGIWLGPYALSLYYLEAGGRALDVALVPVFPDRLAPEQVVDADELEAGAAHLREAFQQDPRNVQALRLLARAYLSQGKPEAALEVLQQALTARPANPLLHLELGDVYDTLGQTEEAVQAYESGGVGSRGLPLAANYLKLADAKAQAGGGDAAIILWRKTLAVDPGNLYALYRLAEIHYVMGDEQTAAVYEERLQYSQPQSITVPLDLRLAEYQAQAMAALVDEGIWEWSTLLDVVSYQVGRFAEGVPGLMVERELQVLLERWPADPDLLFYMARLRQC
jgi:Tfp pilus assembly protein PilF